ncbi:hypothetical protein PseudUWO311_23285 [Pseudanabaena sp. UWO311]|uniref:hypothetical protein n=1 Tax=Pseudanabaena sp. UWO311 TaxID=2487337 RepID=UPI0011577C4D|nr:hypothetical protein [Pseudanabaena sp. UWO311]TYQ23297.1 hypothetical protein PseudUWO311_23285 [Pseudanabaena sp. UWO311]
MPLLHLTLRSLSSSDRAKHRQVWDFAKQPLGLRLTIFCDHLKLKTHSHSDRLQQTSRRYIVEAIALDLK